LAIFSSIPGISSAQNNPPGSPPSKQSSPPPSAAHAGKIFSSGTPEELQAAEGLSFGVLNAHVKSRGRHFGSSGDTKFLTRRLFVDQLAMAHAHVQQLFHGVPVFTGEAIVHLHPDGSLASFTDDLKEDLSVDTQPTLMPQQAEQTATRAYGCSACLTAAPVTTLWILRRSEGDHLAYKVELRREDQTNQTALPIYFVDAHTGEIVFQYDNLQTDAPAAGSGTSLYSGVFSINTWLHASDNLYYLEDHARNLLTGTFNQSTTSVFYLADSDNAWGSAGEQPAVDAHYGAGQVLDYYQNVLGRNGIDGSGGPRPFVSRDGVTPLISSFVHYSTNYNNAFWNGSYMTYGDGDGVAFSPLPTLDIAGHEMTHGVTQFTAGLVYEGESGALNESNSDVFGAMIERYVRGESDNTWLIGEQCYTPGTPGDALRYMNSPHLAANHGYTADDDPDHYSERYTGTLDNGGVHINSGIPNYVFYLLAKGGTHHLGGSMTGIGADDASKIWYRALTTYWPSGANFFEARLGTLQAAADLFGPNSLQVQAVASAWGLCGVGSPVINEPDPVMPDTPAGLSAVPGLNKVTLNWTPALNAKSYNVKRAATSGGPYTLIGSNQSPAYVDYPASNGSPYYYVVTAVNGPFETSPSNEASAIPASYGFLWTGASTTHPTSWNDSSNWSPAGIPGAGDSATLTGGHITLSNAVAVQNCTILGGVIDGSGSLSISNLFTWKGGQIKGTLNTPAGGYLQISGDTSNPSAGEIKILSGTLNNAGSATQTGSGSLFIAQGGLFTNTGTFTTPDYIYITGDDWNKGGGGYGTFSNAGTFTKSGIQSAYVNVPFNNTGSVNAESANLIFYKPFKQTAGETHLGGGTLSAALDLQGGKLTGSGSLSGSVINAGTISPGTLDQPGVLTLTGPYTQTPSGTLSLKVGGGTPGTGFDVFNVIGTAALAGSLQKRLVGGFLPNPGDSFKVLTYTSHSGLFSSTNALNPGSGSYDLLLDTHPDYTRLVYQIPVASATRLTSSLNPSISGQLVTFTATVAPGTAGLPIPTGIVTFKNGGAFLGTGTLNGAGQATFSTVALPTGIQTISAGYSGNATYGGSVSGNLFQAVNPPGSNHILWKNDTTRQLAYWVMSGKTLTKTEFIGTIPVPGWTTQGIGDFSGDGHSDILWKNDTTRQLAYWVMNGKTLTKTEYIGTVPAAGWTIQGVGDFSGDGRPDILWKNDTTRQLAYWVMSGKTLTKTEFIGTIPVPGWTVRGIGDFSGGGHPDILWMNDTTRQLAYWVMNGKTLSRVDYIGTLPMAGLTVQGIGDFSGDGHPDILWKDDTTRQLSYWVMNGKTPISTENIGTVPLAGWTVQGLGVF
jgi:Zn-dependent metalloprotease